MPRKRPHRANRGNQLRQTRESIKAARQAAEQVAQDDPSGIPIDPASQLFFEYAAPLLLNTRDDREFAIATEIAEFVWTNTFLDPATQALTLAQFIQQTNIPDEMVPWLMDVYAELAARKQTLVG
jgi:hypothetical protein